MFILRSVIQRTALFSGSAETYWVKGVQATDAAVYNGLIFFLVDLILFYSIKSIVAKMAIIS